MPQVCEFLFGVSTAPIRYLQAEFGSPVETRRDEGKGGGGAGVSQREVPRARGRRKRAPLEREGGPMLVVCFPLTTSQLEGFNELLQPDRESLHLFIGNINTCPC